MKNIILKGLYGIAWVLFLCSISCLDSVGIAATIAYVVSILSFAFIFVFDAINR